MGLKLRLAGDLLYGRALQVALGGEKAIAGIVENMTAAMDKAEVPLGPQNRLPARLATFRGEIIYR